MAVSGFVLVKESIFFFFLSLPTPSALVAVITVFKNEQTPRKQLLTSVRRIGPSIAH